MPSAWFEHEERYKVIDPQATEQALGVAAFVPIGTERQTDHWFIPRRIMTPEEQAQWFDYESGYALRIRETVTPEQTSALITAKRTIHPGDHSALTNAEKPLTTMGTAWVLATMGEEFAAVVANLRSRDNPQLSFVEAKQLIESAGRKEYLTLDKHRVSFKNPTLPNIVVDLDTVPALKDTGLGFYASIEIEYKGSAGLDEARSLVRTVSTTLGYDQKDILDKALPGLAIPYLAKF